MRYLGELIEQEVVVHITDNRLTSGLQFLAATGEQ